MPVGVRFGHEVNGEGRQIAAALVDAVVQHHAVEAQQVFGGRIQAPSRRREHCSLPVFCGITAENGRCAYESSVLLHVHHGDARNLVGGRIEKRVLHAERPQDSVGDEVLIFLAGTHLDQASQNFYAGAAVAPLRAGLKQKRLPGELPHHLIQGHVHQLRIVVDCGGRGVLNAGRVGQKIANGDGVIGYAETGRVRANIGCDVLVVKLRQILLDGIAQRELSFLGQHHDADRGDGLRHGHDLEDGVLLNR